MYIGPKGLKLTPFTKRETNLHEVKLILNYISICIKGEYIPGYILIHTNITVIYKLN